MFKNKSDDKNFSVIIYENDYPNVGGIATLVGIYNTHRSAAFISKIVKEKNKLPFFPIIEPTNAPPTSTKVEDYLKRLEKMKKDKS